MMIYLWLDLLIDLNPVEVEYCPSMIGLDKCNASYNVVFPKICVQKKTKDTDVKVII